MFRLRTGNRIMDSAWYVGLVLRREHLDDAEGFAMSWAGAVAAVVLMAVVLIDAFEVVLLPRRVRHGFRLARLFYRTSWTVGRTAARLSRPADGARDS